MKGKFVSLKLACPKRSDSGKRRKLGRVSGKTRKNCGEGRRSPSVFPRLFFSLAARAFPLGTGYDCLIAYAANSNIDVQNGRVFTAKIRMFGSASRALFSNLPVCVITTHEQKQLGSQRIVAAQSSLSRAKSYLPDCFPLGN